MARACILVGLTLFLFLQQSVGIAACKSEQIKLAEFKKASALGIQLVEQLEKLNPKVALVGRAGSDLSEYGLKYSHAGLVYRNHPKGKWIFTHLLVKCGEKKSNLYDEGTITFFTDKPHRYRAIVLIPDMSIQNELEHLLLSGSARNLHEQKYNVIANPANPVYQNSNQWPLEMIAVAKSIHLPDNKRKFAIELAQQYGYQPEVVKISGVKQLFAPLVSSHLRTSDHDQKNRLDGNFPVVSVRSIIEFLKLNNDVEALIELELGSIPKTLVVKDEEAQLIDKPVSNLYLKTGVPRNNVQAAQNQSNSAFWGAN